MKNFYESTATRNNLTRQIILILKPKYGNPYARVEINTQTFYEDILAKEVKVTTDVPLIEPIKITIHVQRTHPEAVEIEKITIDNFEVMPLYLHHSSPSTSYLDYNGSWHMEFENFNCWRHKISGQGWIA